MTTTKQTVICQKCDWPTGFTGLVRVSGRSYDYFVLGCYCVDCDLLFIKELS